MDTYNHIKDYILCYWYLFTNSKSLVEPEDISTHLYSGTIIPTKPKTLYGTYND